ncbi:MAG: CotH kinase family protein, partial [Lachnospiraceae bacterium]|nr:CotH kinase family protein [Lachnospiraceae bacterium]
MKNRNLSGIYRILIVAVPLVVIAALLYAKVLQLQAHSDKGTHLLINEVVADNLSTLKDENGVYADWIELYNPTDQEISLKGYYLSDTKNELTKWAFPDVSIDSGGYLVVFCDGNSKEDILHANFFINAGKETIYLSDENENVIDSMKLENQQCDIPYGRMYGNAGETGFLPYSTPAGPNPAYFAQNTEPEADWGEVHFSLEGGRYDENIEVELSCDVEGAAILYTLDGSEPDINSLVYSEPIEITNEGRPNQYTTKKCVLTPSENADNSETQYGVNEVYKATAIRARILKDAKFSTSIQTNTYFIQSDYTLPIVSITTDPYALFDDTEGAYVLGYTYYTMRKYGGSSRRVNSNMPRDLTGHVEIYDTDGSVFKDDMTFAIAGKSSISRNIQKSFNIVLDNKKITGDMFGASDALEYERFTLRGPGSGVVKENLYAYSSAFVSNFISDAGVGAQKSRFCILFIDGEYWGLYSLMEPKGKEYIYKHTGAAKKDITLVIPWKYISADEFDQLFEAVSARDFYNEEDYEWIKTEIDIESFMEFLLAEAFFGNTDGASNGDHNLHIWKEKGGLWKWYVFD